MASSLEILNAANVQFLRNPPQFVAAQGVAQSLTNGAVTAIIWAAPTTDTYTGWSSGSPTRYTPKVAGTYLVTTSVGFAVSATGGRAVEICKNGPANIVCESCVAAAASFNTFVPASYPVPCNGSTDFIEIYVDQNSGGALSTIITQTLITISWLHA